MRCLTLISVYRFCLLVRVYLVRVLELWLYRLPLALIEHPEKAGLSTSMTSNTADLLQLK